MGVHAPSFHKGQPESSTSMTDIYLHEWSIFMVHPRKTNMDTKNGHIQKEPTCSKPSFLGIYVSFRGCKCK